MSHSPWADAMSGPSHGSVWEAYWTARAAPAASPNTLFDQAIATLHDLRAREGAAHPAQDLELFDAVMVLLAGFAVRHPRQAGRPATAS